MMGHIMKRFISAFGIILFLIFNNSSAQNFFPLQVGNKYQIQNNRYAWGPGGYHHGSTGYNVTSVIKDTILNGLTFFLVKNPENYNPFQGTFFFHYDSVEQKLFIKIPGDDTIRLACDFNTPADLHYVSYILGTQNEFISHGISSQIVLGDTLLVYEMESPIIGSNLYLYNFADKIGLFYFEYTQANPPFSGFWLHYKTISAIIDSTIFNPLVLKIDSLYPVMNRPIDTFPYLLYIPFQVSYPSLIDTFFITVEVERNSAVIFAHDYPISISNPQFQLNPENLEVGDIIKLKATITDYSMYNNIETYPDTGWTTFQVLPPILRIKQNSSDFSYELKQNYPDPFNPTTKIRYQIPKMSKVMLTVYDVLGRKIQTLVNEEKPRGSFEVEFDASNLSSGVYIYQLRTTSFVQTRKMVLSK